MGRKKIIDVSRLPVISISGKKGFGKDFWSDYIAKKYKNVEKVAYADETRAEVDLILKLYEEDKKETSIIAKELGATESEINEFVNIYNGSSIKYPELTSRSRTVTTLKLLQYWGTSVRRSRYGKDYWIKKLFKKIHKGNEEGKVYVISDARFPNEVEAVHKNNGLAIRIVISPEEQSRRLRERDGFVPDITQLSHVSETGLDKYNNFHLTLNTELNDDNLTEALIDDKIASWNIK